MTARTSMADKAYAELRDRIIACEIAPGAWVTESRLSTELGYGKTPTREALGRLAAEGFADSSHRRGYQVTPITIAGVIELFEAFAVIVPGIGVLVAERASIEEKRELAELTRSWLSDAAQGKVRSVRYPYRRFAELARNRTLEMMVNGVVGHLERMFAFAMTLGAFEDERSYLATAEVALAAIEKGSVDETREALEHLTEVSREAVVNALQASPSLLMTPVEMHHAGSSAGL